MSSITPRISALLCGLILLGAMASDAQTQAAARAAVPSLRQSPPLETVRSGRDSNLACTVMSLGVGANLNGFRPFVPTSPWNTDISNAPVDPNSSAIINYIGGNIGIHADFGAGVYNGSTIGIPYEVVGGSQTFVPISAQYSD